MRRCRSFSRREAAANFSGAAAARFHTLIRLLLINNKHGMSRDRLLSHWGPANKGRIIR